MLRKIRLTLAIICFTLITLLFLDFTGTLHTWFGWLAKIQFLPAVLALNLGVVIALVIITLLFGRVYCSVICPLGVFQDIASWISARRKKKKYRFSYAPAHSWLRYIVLAIFIITLLLGPGAIAAIIAPYSAYGRIAQNLFAPIYGWCNNLLAYFAERADSYAFYSTEVWIRSIPVFVIAAVTFVALIVLAWRNGRIYCNTICPVGTLLGCISKFSIWHPAIDPDKCKDCSLCSRTCKSSCIDYKNHSIDYSRCVACMDCLEVCKHDAIHFTRRKKAPAGPARNSATARIDKAVADNSRRNFLLAIGAVTASAAVKAQEKKVDGGLAVILDKKIPDRQTPIVPPGAMSIRNMTAHCTGCQLCVAACPNGVLRPSTKLERFMQPESSYERGYCRPECVKCSEVCPTGAIVRLSQADKSSIQIGHAVWVRDNCVPLTDGVECGNCARHCPTGAITMIPSDPKNQDSPKIPAVNTERCIGCGACENLCPARPFSAIYVEGHLNHRII